MEDNDLFTNHQHGFKKRKSCVTQLLESIQKWTELLDQGDSVDVIYLDFQKAFDSVPHQRLLKKIYGYGIRGNLYNSIYDFLTNRRQRVVMNSAKIRVGQYILSGIPQESVLGPLLFLLYINDLPSVVQSYIKIFADDTKLFGAIKDEYDSEVLQNDLHLPDEWSTTWQINFNITKCKVLHLGKKNQQEICWMHEHDKTILSSMENVTEHPDLGVLMDTSLSFNKHISSIILKANKILATTKRSFKYLTEQTFPLLYKKTSTPSFGILQWCLESTPDKACESNRGYTKAGNKVSAITEISVI